MRACPSCSAELANNPKFCPECGNKLAGADAFESESRRVVTILFSDVTGSTALGEHLDPEAVRVLMGRYFAAMKSVIESHGGTVEKFIGDAVMAVFGLPTLHEDDALRAVRAADAMRRGVGILDVELQRDHGLRFVTRTGINTGEVIAGDSATQTLVTGDAVNTAARLEQAAEPGTIVIGELTFRLVREAVDATPLKPIDAKGKSDAVAAYRVDAVAAQGSASAQPTAGTLVGRKQELHAIRSELERSISTHSVNMVTVLAQAGTGKSRLVREITARLPEGVRALSGRCLPYGGAAYWPVREVMRSAAHITQGETTGSAVKKLRQLVGDGPESSSIGGAVAQLIGLIEGSATQDEMLWAVRRAFEHLARESPTVITLEDLHWADAAMLDLLEYVLDLATDAPLLFVTTARPDLLEARPGWGSDRANSQLIRLESLEGDDIVALCRAQEGGNALSDDLVARIVSTSEGNPLFIEQLVGVLRDDGVLLESTHGWTSLPGEVTIPPTIRALVASRLDRLPAETRRVAERSSVIGRVFETTALAQLAPPVAAAHLTNHLVVLVRREFIRPTRADVGTGDAFAFRHALIRDAAYDGLPKRERADLHERLAEWLEGAVGNDLGQYQEVIAHHLAEAARYRIALRTDDERAPQLARRAAEHLSEVGRRDYDAGAVRRAASVLVRAVDLLGSAAGAELLIDAGDAAVRSGDDAGFDLLRRAIERADAAGDLQAAAVARIVQAVHENWHARMGIDEAVATVEASIAVIEPMHDPAALAKAYGALGFVKWGLGQLEEARLAAQRGIEFAEEAGLVARARRGMAVSTAMTVDGPMPTEEALAWCEEVLALHGQSRSVRYVVRESMGGLFGLQGRINEAREALVEAGAIAADLGHTTDEAAILLTLAVTLLHDGEVGDAEAMTEEARRVIGTRATSLVLVADVTLARVRLAQRQAEAALALLDQHDAASSDVPYHAEWLVVRAQSLVPLNRLVDAKAAATKSMHLLQPTDLVVQQCEAFETLASVELALGDRGRAEELLHMALNRYAAKQALMPLTRVRSALEALTAGGA